MNRMTQQSDPLKELIRLEQEEIARHKWIESEKAGRDIGLERAIADWLEKHFAEWEHYLPSRAIDEALHVRVPERER